MNIALIHFRVGETDGVSLEMDKWRDSLCNLGHTVYYIAGSAHDKSTLVIPEMAYDNVTDLEIANECYEQLISYTPESLEQKIRDVASLVQRQMVDFITKLHLDFLIINNIFALARSIPIALGIRDAILLTGVKAVGHHHDFYWERTRYSKPTCPFVSQCLNELYPPFSKMQHVVINSAAKRALWERKHLDSVVVPNVFDFEQPLWEKDDYNSDLREAFNLNTSDVVFLQATRVVNRKGIELAIRTIAELNRHKQTYVGKSLYDGRLFDQKTRFVLLCVGLHEGTEQYEQKLLELAKELDVMLIMDPTKVAHTRKMVEGKKMYSLWDCYGEADIISYPSIYEGFGNQFLEALFAKKPMLVYEYSVLKEDIRPKGFSYASLGDEHFLEPSGLVCVKDEYIQTAIHEVYAYLFDSEYRDKAISRNFQLGKQYYSLATLQNLVKEIIFKSGK